MTHFLMKHAHLLLVPALLVGCSYNAKLTPEGEKVTLLQSGKPSKGCAFLGEVKAYDRNGMSQSYQSHEHLIQDERNILRNEAALLGANTVLVTQHQQTYEGKPKNDFVADHWMVGRAYRCKIRQ
ncbi:TPA: DUF4156 domain-containing protein [Legionella pneumophila]|uniref:Outer membrane lipoprotein n=2 Tax=Legionella TaxID=445 RepID=A0A378PGT2_9GAMM|nr:MULTISPECIES: DUF4156 domain-containing protein [Legionella]KTD70558.1 putative outer membrane lipoprotein [Legionella steigerwaltii]MCZ4692071.1 DUF4156 domain-containing protein [Legionella pneumophila]MCZ4709348.1 DUF4156 domain-containing protein [Legionella pneumophila]MCZ4719590.1 DUF4156 domain-containing protein [Legionella pneumophila]WBA07459.1 putative outer membrane lipoprotein [Legionella pneumophila]